MIAPGPNGRRVSSTRDARRRGMAVFEILAFWVVSERFRARSERIDIGERAQRIGGIESQQSLVARRGRQTIPIQHRFQIFRTPS